MEEKNTFTIDFFEFSFLVEACLPPKPIARAMFFQRVIDSYYHQMSPSQRANLHDWLQNHLDRTQEDAVIFDLRYNPDNQYLVTVDCQGEEKQVEAFRRNERYYTARTTFISPEFITKVDKIPLANLR